MQLFKLLKNAGFSLTASVLSTPFQALSIILLARSLGVEPFGAYTFAFEFGFLFSRFAESGLNVLATRELAKHPDEAATYLGNLLGIRLITTVVFYVLMMVIAEFSSLAPEIVQILWVVGAASFCQSFALFISGVFRAYERQDLEGIPIALQSISFFIAVLIGVFVVDQGDNLTYVIWSLFVSYGLMLAVSWALMTHYLVRPRWSWNPKLVGYFLREALPIAIAFALAATYSRLEVLVLQSRSLPFEVGLFTAAFRLINNLGVIPYILAGAWLPSLSRTAWVNPPEFRLHGMRLYKLMFLIGAPLTVGSVVLAKPIIEIIYSNLYLPSVPAFQLLMLSTFFFFLSFANKTLLESCNRQVQWTIALGIGLVMGLGLSFLWIPPYGAVGASWATLASNLSILLYTLVAVASLRVWQPILNPLGRIILASGIMGIAIAILLPISWLLAGGIGVGVYGVALLGVQIISPTEALRVVRVIYRRRSQGRLK